MKKFAIATSLALIFSPVVPTFASGMSIVGTIPTVVETHNPSLMGYAGSQVKPNIILLQKIELTPSAQIAFANRIEKMKQPTPHTFSASATNDASKLPSKIDIGMNNVPVLNQGAHGSCVTFAVAGSLDTLIAKGDYVSELCSLTLGNALEAKNSNYPSGWNGSIGPIVLKQFFDYGIVSMKNQKEIGCGGLTAYPASNPVEEGTNTTPKEYSEMSESINNQYEWHSMFSSDIAFIDASYNPKKMLLDVKNALNEGVRVTFGVLLDVTYGSNGAVGTHHVRNDTWMLTPAIEDDVINNRVDAGHEMIIIGYDDDAIVKDNSGHENKGLLTLRNSWSQFAGDHGNYYMSYDHFKLMALETQVATEKK